MGYLTIRTGGAQPARRVDLAQFANLFAEAEPTPAPRPAPVPHRLRLLAAGMLLVLLVGNLALTGRSAGPFAADAPARVANRS